MPTPHIEHTPNHALAYHAPHMRTARVVVVERDAALREAIAGALRSCGHDVIKVGNPKSMVWYMRKVVSRIPERRADAIVFGVDAGYPSDVNALAELRGDHREVPLLILVGKDGTELYPDPRRVYHATMLTKPFRMDVLQTAVTNILQAN